MNERNNLRQQKIDADDRVSELNIKKGSLLNKLDNAKSALKAATKVAEKGAMTVAKNACKAAIKALPGIGIVWFVIEVIMTILVSFIQSCLYQQNCSGENGIVISFKTMDYFSIWGHKIWYPVPPQDFGVRGQQSFKR